MRRLILFMTTTLDGFIAKEDGGLWDAFPWPDEMQAFANDFYRTVDTAIYGRHAYDAIVPWWRNVAEGRYPTDVQITERELELAAMLQQIEKIVFSTTLPTDGPDTVLRGNPIDAVTQIKSRPGGAIVLHAGADLVAPLAEASLIDEYLLFVTPAALGSGRTLFAGLHHELPLELAETRVFDDSVVLLRFHPASSP
jgi:dihydrofolate reductase